MAASLEVMQWKSRSLPAIDCCIDATIAEEEAFNRENRLPAEAKENIRKQYQFPTFAVYFKHFFLKLDQDTWTMPTV